MYARRSLLPIFHASFSLGALIGVGTLAETVRLPVIVIWHPTAHTLACATHDTSSPARCLVVLLARLLCGECACDC